jgi:uncharacterized membrane protein/FtsH-binding integral membrane protein
MDLWQLLGDLHPKLVHVPLILLLAGLLFDLVGVVARSERAHWAARALTCVGTVGLLFAFICGIYAEVWAGRAGIPHHAIEFHEITANVASWGFVVLAAWRLFLKPANRGWMALYVLIGLAWYLLLILTAWLGGALVYEYGAAVTGARANSALSLHDLNTLATRQTDENLKYSEMMHHIFGWMTLALSVSLFANVLLPRHAHKLRWFGPTLFLLGGIFLFIFADLDLYAWNDPLQWKDREVQLHKTISVVMAVVGIVGLRRSLKPTPVGSRGATYRASFDFEEPAQSGSITGLLVAVMALIGGGMLFTHVHTVAPYANVAAGVYVAHVVLGLVALAIGASRLMADAMPSWRGFFSLAFALFMCVQSVLLITYNEGLPWYIGYGQYDRWGPNGGTVAPYGPIRAELTFDESKGRVQVQLFDRFDDKPVEVKSPPQHVLIARGYQELAIPLREAGFGRYTGEAPFLRDVPAFSARMRIPNYGMGYFDPWVTSAVVAVPPNETARFVCPMHEGVRKTAAGDCNLCAMPLVPIDTAPRDTLHDAAYDMQLASSGDSAGGAGLSRRLTLTPTKDGQALRDLARVHEYFLHLIVVSPDLGFFDHVHPEPQPDGSFTIDYTFPSGGSYLLFADITPKGARSQVFRLPVSTTGSSSTTMPSITTAQLAPSPALAKPLAADPTIVAELHTSPRTSMAGMHSQLLFRLSRNGQPITDLEPYIGAMGHCVIVSDDTQSYLHSHPEQLLAPKPDARGGPEVAFHTRFPKPGRYKIWGQFKRGEQILVADFVLDVRPSPLPQSVMNFVFGE